MIALFYSRRFSCIFNCIQNIKCYLCTMIFWSHLFVCFFTDVNCGPLPQLDHGFINLKDNRTTHGANVFYTCHENYTLSGHEQRVCQDNGSWSGETPKCLFDWCPDPPPVIGGYYSTSGRRVGDRASYGCQPGYILFGQDVLSCEFGGKWSGKAPTCKFVDCGAPPHIDNGKYDLLNDSTTFDSVVQYSCGDDFWLLGEARQKCTKEGKWSADAPSCASKWTNKI